MQTYLPVVLIVLTAAAAAADGQTTLRIATDETDFVLQTDREGRLCQTYFGEKLLHATDLSELAPLTKKGHEAYATEDGRNFFEPALGVTHSNGNPSGRLRYVSSTTAPTNGGTQTDIVLRDEVYPLDVVLHYVAYERENVIETWSDIRHSEPGPVTLTRYASGLLYLGGGSYYLTEFTGDWAREVRPSTQQLQPGKKIVDSKLGSRAAMLASPFFEVGLGAPVEEGRGTVLMGTVEWTGNFSLTFEVDNAGVLRVVPGINPYASAYELAPGETFTTPRFTFTLSHEGTGHGSRNLHDWARRHALHNGTGSRMTLLNNWESTGFAFDEGRLRGLMGQARQLGVDAFLLDDGWFGRKYPRNNDCTSLGDWTPAPDKLPGGIAALTRAASDPGVHFGLWVEPEMVSPKSELYEQHPDWAIGYPNRKPYYFRNQLVLDLANPEVQRYVAGTVVKLLTEHPDIAFVKWDCNSPIMNAWSPYLGRRQGRLYIDHVRGLYNVLHAVRRARPDVEMMLCAGGGGRCDYGALRHFDEFWPSDNTDPVERLYIQWGFSQFFPAKALCAHVTGWNGAADVKFRTDVASMCKLGFDIDPARLSANERAFCRQAVANWRSFAPAVMEGDQHRLVSPHTSNHMAVAYVSKDRGLGVLFAYDIHPRYDERPAAVRLEGLDPDRRYRVEEVNLMPGARPSLPAHGRTFTGDYLMKVGLDVFTGRQMNSRVVRLTAE